MKSIAQDKQRPRGNSKHAFHVGKTDLGLLADIACRAMAERRLEPEVPFRALQQLASIHTSAHEVENVRDMRNLLWAAIDNNDSRDLDQLTVAMSLDAGRVRILVAVVDVNALVPKNSTIDDHAACNTTSVYTPAVMFPMLQLPLSSDLTSLNKGEDRIAVVTNMVFDAEGALVTADQYPAHVRKHAKPVCQSLGVSQAGEESIPGPIHPADLRCKSLATVGFAAASGGVHLLPRLVDWTPWSLREASARMRQVFVAASAVNSAYSASNSTSRAMQDTAAVISKETGPVTVCCIRTDEEWMIASSIIEVLGISTFSKVKS